MVTAKTKYKKIQKNTPLVATVKREKEKKEKNTLVVVTAKREKTKKTSLSCTRVRLPPEVNDTMAGAKWANHLVAPQDNGLILIN